MHSGKIWLFVVSVDGVPFKVFTEHCNAEACIARLVTKHKDVRLTELLMNFRLSIFFDGYE